MRTTYSEPSALRCPESICSSEVLFSETHPAGVGDAQFVDQRDELNARRRLRVRPENSTSLLQIDSGAPERRGFAVRRAQLQCCRGFGE
ncbi:hypothetical protein [Pseudomonas syringae]|uniref:hypothetical protein n=1 Tax=Pseudomonas syringae TaxID=317 RepID=UPI00294AF8BF|nr:hypothetical protein [Pseudomonas syringae]WOK32158.1 hypothetical protein RRP28_28305 [Pseudomonas syringae pv. actinidiae]